MKTKTKAPSTALRDARRRFRAKRISIQIEPHMEDDADLIAAIDRGRADQIGARGQPMGRPEYVLRVLRRMVRDANREGDE